MNLLYFSALVTVASGLSFPLKKSLNPRPTVSSAPYRLPVHAHPVHYDLVLEPNLIDFNFNGNVTIEIEITKEANNLTLHAYNLTVTVEGISFSNATGEVQVKSVNYDEKYQFLVILFGNSVAAGSYVLKISYEGYLNSDNKGLYRGNYVNSEGEKRWFALTQFEPTYARYAFPCFDEPALKAEFTISIIRKSTYSAISNMNLNYSTQLDNDRVRDTFQRSVKMSTYLASFVVSDFANVSSEIHSVFARKCMIEDGRGEYALKIGVDTLKALEEYTNISYALDKIYHVGIPNDYFLNGGMENWGVVIYKEAYLLYKENVSTAGDKLIVTTIIAHELAHQWFGNLVTLSWWTYLWLNEGFASYFEYYATSLVQPTWRIMDAMLVISIHTTMRIDSSTSTRPMSSDAGSPSEIYGLFDVVSYNKAGAVVRMMEHIVTREVLKEGLRIYLKKRSYDVAEPSHLWSSIQTALDNSNVRGILPSGTTIGDVMETWSTQSGYPIVNVVRNYEKGSVTFTQRRFLHSHVTHNYNETYSIPINFATSEDRSFNVTTPTLWLTGPSLNYDLSLTNTSWIIVNKQQTGYYRVNYDTSNWKLIINHLKNVNHTDVHVLNRAQLLDDAFNLASSGHLNASILFELLEYIIKETDPIPIQVILGQTINLDRSMSGTDYYEKFQKFITNILSAAFKTVGTDLKANDTILDIFNRINIIKWLCLYGDSNCRVAMREKLSARTFVHPDLQEAVYCGGMRTGSSDDWDYLYQLYVSKETEESQKSRLISALGCSLNETLLKRLLNSSLGLDANYTFRPTDTLAAFSAAYTGSYIGVLTTLEFILEQFNDILERLSPSQVSTILVEISLRLWTFDQYEKLHSFFATQQTEVKTTISTAFSTALNNVKSNLKWYERSYKGIKSYFEG